MSLATSSVIKVSFNKNNGQIQANAPVTLTTKTATRLDSLQDVVEGSPTDGSTLVYRSSDDKYVVQQISLDGGSF